MRPCSDLADHRLKEQSSSSFIRKVCSVSSTWMYFIKSTVLAMSCSLAPKAKSKEHTIISEETLCPQLWGTVIKSTPQMLEPQHITLASPQASWVGEPCQRPGTEPGLCTSVANQRKPSYPNKSQRMIDFLKAAIPYHRHLCLKPKR